MHAGETMHYIPCYNNRLTIIGLEMACHLAGMKPLSEPMLEYG